MPELSSNKYLEALLTLSMKFGDHFKDVKGMECYLMSKLRKVKLCGLDFA
jgi:hypothetical protein